MKYELQAGDTLVVFAFIPHSEFRTPKLLVMDRDRLHGRDDLLVGHLLGGAGEPGVLRVEQQCEAAVRVAAGRC